MSIAVLALVGMVLSFFSSLCTDGHEVKQRDAALFGKIQWAHVGVIGYIILALTHFYPTLRVGALLILACVTVWLIIKAYKIKLNCVMCAFVWVLNIVILIVALTQGLK